MISILISSCQGGIACELCIESILKRTRHPDYKIIVYDSSGEGQILEYLKKQRDAGNIALLTCPTPVVHGYAIEQLLGACNTEYACILDSDTEVNDGAWLNYLIKQIADNKILGVSQLRSGSFVFLPKTAYAPVYWAACLLLNMQAYREFGFSGQWSHKKVPFVEYLYKDCLHGSGKPEYIYYDTAAEFTEKILHDNPGQYKIAPFPKRFWGRAILHYGGISRNWPTLKPPKIAYRIGVMKERLAKLRNE